MPVSKTYLKSLVNRLCTLPGQKGQGEMYDSPGDAKIAIRTELGQAIERACGSDEHADRVVEQLMRGTFRPVAGEIASAALATAEVEVTPAGCELCGGRPWVSVEKLVWEFPKAAEGRRGLQYMGAGAERCECAKGQWFRQKDRENKSKREMGLPV